MATKHSIFQTSYDKGISFYSHDIDLIDLPALEVRTLSIRRFVGANLSPATKALSTKQFAVGSNFSANTARSTRTWHNNSAFGRRGSILDITNSRKLQAFLAL